MPRKATIPALMAFISLYICVYSGCAAHRQTDDPTATGAEIPIVILEPFEGGSRFEGDLEETLRRGPSRRFLRCLVDLDQQVDIWDLSRRIEAAGLSKHARRTRIISALETVAENRQESIRPLIESLRTEGEIDYVRPVAIVNRLVVEGTATGLLKLSEHPAVGRILMDWSSLEGSGSGRPYGNAGPAHSSDSWAIDATGARELWSGGLDGGGILVAAIDTGVNSSHEQLAGRMMPGGRGWFDASEGREDPYDSHGHGTSVLSQAVSANINGRSVGIAPGANWAMALGNNRNYYSRSRMTVAADWILRTCRPDVLINAWSHNESACTTFDLPFINAWKASGIFVVFPSGNSGPNQASGEAPAHLAGVIPNGGAVFSVSGLDAGLEPSRISSRGPSRCGSERFPSLALPGETLPIALPSGISDYGLTSGTSLSAGLMGGAAALLLQADPELLPWELEEILLQSARDLPPAGWDIETGAGLLDLPAALELIRERQSQY